jgi:Coenzyme PQQ synthesis protein D (PqqD)
MVQRNSAVLWRELDGEAVLLNPEVGASYTLNRVGTLIWKMLDGMHTPDDIAGAICQVYQVEHERALQDVASILADLRENNLLKNSLSSPRPVV